MALEKGTKYEKDILKADICILGNKKSSETGKNLYRYTLKYDSLVEIEFVSVYNDSCKIRIISSKDILKSRLVNDSYMIFDVLKKDTYHEIDVDKESFEKLIANGYLKAKSEVVQESSSSSKLPWIIGGIAVVGAIWYFTRKK